MTDNLQNAIGQVQATQKLILEEVRSLRKEFGDHKTDDQRSFSDNRKLSYQVKQDIISYVDAGLKERARDSNQHLNEQDVKIDGIDDKVSKILNNEAIKLAAKKLIETQLTTGQKLIAAIGGFVIFCLTIYATFFKK